MRLREFAVRRMNRRLRRRQAEDQPPMSHIDRAKRKDVGEECAVCLGVLAVEQDVRSKNHAAEYTPPGVERGWCPVFGCSLSDPCLNFSAFSAVRIFPHADGHPAPSLTYFGTASKIELGTTLRDRVVSCRESAGSHP